MPFGSDPLGFLAGEPDVDHEGDAIGKFRRASHFWLGLRLRFHEPHHTHKLFSCKVYFYVDFPVPKVHIQITETENAK
jgi:hypothetical protein